MSEAKAVIAVRKTKGGVANPNDLRSHTQDRRSVSAARQATPPEERRLARRWSGRRIGRQATVDVHPAAAGRSGDRGRRPS